MKVLYVGNILPIEVVEKLRLSIAGKKYEMSLTRSLNNILNKDLEIISVSKTGRKESKDINNFNIFPNKKFKLLRTCKFPVINDFISNVHFFLVLLFWSVKNIRHKRVILILNSPIGLCISAVIFKYLVNVKPVSLTIDTPFVGENSFKGIIGYYHKTAFKWGHKIINCFSGIIILNKGVLEVLKLNIPYHLTSIGFDKSKYSLILNRDLIKVNGPTKENKTAIYAGTLMKSKGTLDLLEAFKRLDNQNIELHIYGYGPLEEEVKDYSNKYANIKYFGRVDNNILLSKLAAADLLVNIIIQNDPSTFFGFPSKLIEYILSGSPVLTTKFRSLPDAYLPFVFLIEKETPEGISNGIQSVFNESEEIIKDKISNGIDYVTKFQNWEIISLNIVDFLKRI